MCIFICCVLFSEDLRDTGRENYWMPKKVANASATKVSYGYIWINTCPTSNSVFVTHMKNGWVWNRDLCQAENLRSKPTVVSNYMIGSKADLQRPAFCLKLQSISSEIWKQLLMFWGKLVWNSQGLQENVGKSESSLHVKRRRHLTLDNFCHQATWTYFPDAGWKVSFWCSCQDWPYRMQ